MKLNEVCVEIQLLSKHGASLRRLRLGWLLFCSCRRLARITRNWSSRSPRKTPARFARPSSSRVPTGRRRRKPDDILRENGVLVESDVIANAGGVTVSYFERVQDFSSIFWSEEDINTRLTRIMRDGFAAIWQVAQDKDVSVRAAAFVMACTCARLVSVMN